MLRRRLQEGARARLASQASASNAALARGGAGRVVEAAQHAGHVAQRRSGQAALGQRTRRLALEVDDANPPSSRASSWPRW